jgi:hypothetical protein
MDGLPNELIKLCGLASMAECGDHFWASVPALGIWAAACRPFARHLKGWRVEAPDIRLYGTVEKPGA